MCLTMIFNVQKIIQIFKTEKPNKVLQRIYDVALNVV